MEPQCFLHNSTRQETIDNPQRWAAGQVNGQVIEGDQLGCVRIVMPYFKEYAHWNTSEAKETHRKQKNPDGCTIKICSTTPNGSEFHSQYPEG